MALEPASFSVIMLFVRKLLIAVALLLGVTFIFINFAEVQDVAEILQRGDWRFLILAIGLQAGWLLNIALSFWVIYRALGLDERLETLFLLGASANFVNVVAPSVGVGGLALFINQAKQRGQSAARVTVAGVLVVLFDYTGFIWVLLVGLFVLFRRNHLNLAEIIATSILLLIACGLASLVYLGMQSAHRMGKVLAWLTHILNKLLWPFIHRQYLSEKRAYAFAKDASAGLHQLRQKPYDLLLPLLLGISGKVLLIIILFLVSKAFQVPLSGGTLIAAFSIGYLFTIVSITPAGIGFVEGALTLGLRSLGVPLGEATVIAMAYRGITLWLPMLFGMLVFRWSVKQHRVEAYLE